MDLEEIAPSDWNGFICSLPEWFLAAQDGPWPTEADVLTTSVTETVNF